MKSDKRKMYIANSLYTCSMRSSNVLRRARVISGMSQIEVARKSCITQSVISDYERGKREPGAYTFMQLLDILGVGIDLRPKRRTRVPALPDSRLARLILRNRREIVELAR